MRLGEKAVVYEMSHAGAVFGLHTGASPVMRNEEYKKLGRLANKGNILGWIPLVGIIAGISRLIFANYMYDSLRKGAEASGTIRLDSSLLEKSGTRNYVVPLFLFPLASFGFVKFFLCKAAH